jgi:hypothetical protein
MNINTQSGAFVEVSIAHNPVLVRPVPLERLVRKNPEGVVYNLLNRAERAESAGDMAEAHALYKEAERLFRLVAG